MVVSGKHYANSVPDELFERAANKAVQNPVQQPAARCRTASQPKNQVNNNHLFCSTNHHNANACENVKRVSEGIRTPDPRDHNAVL